MSKEAGERGAAALFKGAAPRYLQELNKGALGLREKIRLGGSTSALMRKNLQTAATDLNPDQLARHRRLQGMLADATMKFEGGKPINFPGAGPSTVAGVPHVSPQVGTTLRHILETPGARTPMYVQLASGKEMPGSIHRRISKPEDQGFYRSIVNHERGERAMYDGLSGGTYDLNPFASHLGPAANLAERQGVRDPRVHALLDKLRVLHGKDDPRANKLLRQVGVVAGNAPPLGGRAHRSLERLIERMPAANNEGGWRRYATGAPVSGDEKNLSRAHNVVDRISQYAPERYKERINAIRDRLAEPLTRQPRQLYRTQQEVHNHIANFSSLSPRHVPEVSPDVTL